jgi:hypothetical protein
MCTLRASCLRQTSLTRLEATLLLLLLLPLLLHCLCCHPPQVTKAVHDKVRLDAAAAAVL